MERESIIERLKRHTPQEGFNETAIDGLRLYRQDQPATEPFPVIYEPSICIIVQGSKRLVFGRRSILYDEGNFLVNALTLPLHAEMSEASPEKPFLGFLMRFDPLQVSTLVTELDGLVDWPESPMPEIISACPLSEGISRANQRLIACLDDAMDRRILSAGLIREILYEVLRGPKGRILYEQALRGGKAHQIARAVAYIEKHFHQSLDVSTIAKQAAMSPSVLHQHFKRLTALTPMQYVQHLRLHQARTLLLAGHGAAQAGFEVGYNSPSQFSREFRRLFGVPPSRVRVA